MAAARSGKLLHLNTLWTGVHLSRLGVSYYIDNEFPKGESRRVSEHLSKCAKCRLKVADTVNIDRIALRSLPKPSPRALSELFSRLGLKP